MGIKQLIGSLFGFGVKEADGSICIDISDPTCREIASKYAYKMFAIKTAINLIASGLAQSEFVTYENGVEIRGDNYYLLNIEPNTNQNAVSFWADVITKLVNENACLVVQVNRMFYVADTYERSDMVIGPKTYRHVKSGAYQFSDVFTEENVLYFELNDQNIKMVIESMYRDYGNLIEYSQKTFKRNNAKRGTLTIPTNYPTTPEAQEALSKLLNEQLKTFYEAEGGAVLPLTNNVTYEDLSGQTYKNSSDSRDIRNLINDVFEFVAMALQIPPQLMTGSVNETDQVVDRFVIFRVNPIGGVITKEINRKVYGKDAYKTRSYVRLDTSRIKMTNIKDLASAADLLFRTGTHTINDNLKMLGKEPSNDPIASKRFVTKNYQDIEEIERGENTGT